MAVKQASIPHHFEGQQVNICLRDGTRIDDCNLVSAGRNRLDNVWLFVNDNDVFVARSEIIDVWPVTINRPSAA